MVRSTHIRHEILSTDTELVSIALIMRSLVVAVAKLLDKMSPIDLNVIEFLALCCDQNINLISCKVYDFIHSKNYFINIELFDNLIC